MKQNMTELTSEKKSCKAELRMQLETNRSIEGCVKLSCLKMLVLRFHLTGDSRSRNIKVTINRQ